MRSLTELAATTTLACGPNTELIAGSLCACTPGNVCLGSTSCEFLNRTTEYYLPNLCPSCFCGAPIACENGSQLNPSTGNCQCIESTAVCASSACNRDAVPHYFRNPCADCICVSSVTTTTVTTTTTTIFECNSHAACGTNEYCAQDKKCYSCIYCPLLEDSIGGAACPVCTRALPALSLSLCCCSCFKRICPV
eukprot:m.644845 g.644845  ORF g.644845 m.644845 type:complete len:194 (+) comp58352_c0_seq35:3400-3981(+)